MLLVLTLEVRIFPFYIKEKIINNNNNFTKIFVLIYIYVYIYIYIQMQVSVNYTIILHKFPQIP